MLVLLGTCLDTPGMTARQSLIPDLAGRARMPVERPILIGMAVGYLVVTLSMFLNPTLREIERPARVAKGTSAEDTT